MLVRADALANAGGIARIRNALIDDCSLAAKLKAIGPIWVGLTDRVPQRPALWHAVRRQADGFTHRLCPTSLLAVLIGHDDCEYGNNFRCSAAACNLCHWLARVVGTRLPGSRWHYLISQPAVLSALAPLEFALPAIASLYLYYTFDSAYQYLRGRGGQWKGRIHADAPRLQ